MAVPDTIISAMPASLYVGDLHPELSDGALFEAFTEFKSLSSVRVCRDSSSGRSLCYGYVNFLSTQDAIRAIEIKNHTLLHGKFIRVAWSCRDPDARRTGKANIFVKNLSESIDSVRLQTMFRRFGNITSCKIAMSEDGKSKGHGFVQFDNEESANASIEQLDGAVVGTKPIYVAKFIKRSDRVLSRIDAKYTNLYLKNLDLDLKEEILCEKFSEFGKITSLVISKDENGNSRGFGFINFENPDDAKRAAETMNGSQIGSRVVYVARAQKRAERDEILRCQFEERRKEVILKFKDSNIYVKNIDDDVSDEELKQHFSQCGAITSAKVMRDEKGISKGFGFVCFSNPEEASRAVNTFHGFMFHRKPLYVAIAQRKEERQAQLQLQYAQRMAGLAGASTPMIPAPYYYTGPSGLMSQPPSRSGLMYQPLALRPGWRGNLLAAGFQHTPVPMPRSPQDTRINRGRINAHIFPPPVVASSATYIPHLQQPGEPAPAASLKDANQQRVGLTGRYVNGRQRDSVNKINDGAVSSTSEGGTGVEPDPQGTEILSSLLSAASPDRQKQILGERLYPLVQIYEPELVAKITGMLLEMDNSELLLLLESPESLASKVEEAVQVLKLSKTKSSANQTTPRRSNNSNFLSAEVAVN